MPTLTAASSLPLQVQGINGRQRKTMPYTEVMHKFKQGRLKSGSTGKTVTNPAQARAILMSEKEKAEQGNSEYQPKRRGLVKRVTTSK